VSLRPPDDGNPHERLAVSLPPDITMLYYATGWWVLSDRTIPVEFPKFSNLPDEDLAHWEIRRVLSVLADPSPTWEQIKADCVGPDLPTDTSPCDALQDRLTDEMDRRRDAEHALAKVTAERDRLLVFQSTLNKIVAVVAWPALEPPDDVLSMVKRVVDAHAIVSRRLVGSQKEVVEVSAERDEAQAQAKGLVQQVRRLTSQLDDWQADIHWARAERDEATARAAKVEDRLRRDDELREQLAVAVGLDGSASLALILDAVRHDSPDDPRAVQALRALLDYTHAPIRFGDRQLSDAERAAFVIRRLDARVSEAIAAETFLDCAGVPAYAAAPGDDADAPSEHLRLTARLRLHFAGRSS
jgi:hypothetical protein